MTYQNLGLFFSDATRYFSVINTVSISLTTTKKERSKLIYHAPATEEQMKTIKKELSANHPNFYNFVKVIYHPLLVLSKKKTYLKTAGCCPNVSDFAPF